MYTQAKSLIILAFVCVGSATAKSEAIFRWPVDEGKYWLSSCFGPRKKPNGQASFHNGIDMAAPKGTPVHAAASGVVELACEDKGYGKTIVIVHSKIHKTRYAHLSEMQVNKGQRVSEGQLIGKVGSTGNVRASGKQKDPSHLHFEVYQNGERVNPLHYLKKEKQ